MIEVGKKVVGRKWRPSLQKTQKQRPPLTSLWMANLTWDVLEITVSLIINYFDQGFCFLQTPTKVESKDLLSKSLDKHVYLTLTPSCHIPTQELFLPFLNRILSKSNPLGQSLPPSRPLWSKTVIWNEARTHYQLRSMEYPPLPPPGGTGDIDWCLL